ncbi:TPA: hypothetical protein OUB37_002964 [Enterococcus faecalis]|nr:hypothetical protein [Enterococcus faecalis]
MKAFKRINSKTMFLFGTIAFLIGTFLSVNFIPVDTSTMTHEEKNRILNEFAINLKLGRQLQFSSFLFFILGVFFYSYYLEISLTISILKGFIYPARCIAYA